MAKLCMKKREPKVSTRMNYFSVLWWNDWAVMGASIPLAFTKPSVGVWRLDMVTIPWIWEYIIRNTNDQQWSGSICQICIIICLHNHIVLSNLKISLLNQQPESLSQISTSAQNFKQLRIFSGDCRPLYKPNQKPAIPIHGRRGLCRYYGMLDQHSVYGETYHLLFKKSWHYQSFVM